MNLRDVGEAAERQVIGPIDDRVPPAPEVDNVVLADDSRLTRWAGPALLGLSLVLVPWTLLLAVQLPSHHLVAHYDVAWVGFDLMLVAGMLATAWGALRRSRRLAGLASATGTLLVVDAWFDVVMAPTRTELVVALVLALGAELPLALLCFWLSRHAQQLTAERLHLALRARPPRRAPLSRGAGPPGGARGSRWSVGRAGRPRG